MNLRLFLFRNLSRLNHKDPFTVELSRIYYGTNLDVE
jgi:hypothetical protein